MLILDNLSGTSAALRSETEMGGMEAELLYPFRRCNLVRAVSDGMFVTALLAVVNPRLRSFFFGESSMPRAAEREHVILKVHALDTA